MRVLLCFGLLALASFASAKTKLSELTPLCSKSDPNLNDCIKKSSVKVIQHLAEGIRDFGLYPADPLKIPFLELTQAEKALGLKLNVSDSVHTGISRFVVKDVKVNPDRLSYEIAIDSPLYEITGICDIGGKILLLPITGNGFCNLTSYEMDVKMDIKGKEVVKKGKSYYEVEDLKFDIKHAKGAFKLTGLFGGNKQLGDTMNRFLNENSQEVMKEMKGTLDSVWSGIFFGIVSKFFAAVPLDELYAP